MSNKLAYTYEIYIGAPVDRVWAGLTTAPCRTCWHIGRRHGWAQSRWVLV